MNQEPLWAWKYEFAVGTEAPADAETAGLFGKPGPWFFVQNTGQYTGVPVFVWAREKSLGRLVAR